MTDSLNEIPREMPQPCDEWAALHIAAVAAGRWAAQQLAQRCSTWHLGRGGTITVYLEPADSPMVSWLSSRGHATPSATDGTVSVPITLTAADLSCASDPARKAESLLVLHAYAAAFCTILAEQAGVTAEIHITTRNSITHAPQPRQPGSTRGPAPKPAPSSAPPAAP